MAGFAGVASWRSVRQQDETTEKCVAWLRVLHQKWVVAKGEVPTDLMDIAEFKTPPCAGKVRWTGIVVHFPGSTNHAMLSIRPEGESKEFIITQEGVVLVAQDARWWSIRRPTVRVYKTH